jgi:hypothetical protein
VFILLTALGHPYDHSQELFGVLKGVLSKNTLRKYPFAVLCVQNQEFPLTSLHFQYLSSDAVVKQIKVDSRH